MSIAIGIDFGTSNSTVGFSQHGVPQLIELEDKKTAIPTAIFYDTREEKVLFGNRAISSYTSGRPGRLLRALKSVLGTTLIDDFTIIGNEPVYIKDIIGGFLTHLKATAERAIGQQVDSVVMGRPVRFVDADEKADALAERQLASIAESVGFTNILFQYEPIAAALDYEQSVSQEELALIVDIGGGTSDFSVVRVSPDRRGQEDRKNDVLANTGVHIGGTNFDYKLSLEQIMPLLGYGSKTRARYEGDTILDLPSFCYHELATWERIAFLYSRKTQNTLREALRGAERQDLVDRFLKIIKDEQGHRLASDVEAAKIKLSEEDTAYFSLGYVERELTAIVQRSKFEADIEAERAKIAFQIQECLRQAAVSSAEISTLFLTGGSTGIPIISQTCRNIVPAAQVVEGDRFGSVGLGLTIDAGVRFGERRAQGSRPSGFKRPEPI